MGSHSVTYHLAELHTKVLYLPKDGHPSQYYRAQRWSTLFMRRTTLPQRLNEWTLLKAASWRHMPI